MSIFQDVEPFVEKNPKLLFPQVEAYRSALSFYKEFEGDKKLKETLIVMPTGTGKTGLMSILPFKLSEGRVLIIAPGKIIRKSVFQQFDSISNPEETFWYKHDVIADRTLFPKSYLYRGWNTTDDSDRARVQSKLSGSDIVITNIHKITGSSEDQSLVNLVDSNFFDMIIIDEAHHVAADMWQKTLQYFNVRKVVKLTATPVRADGRFVSNNPYDPIYSLGLGEAIKARLVKDIIKKEEIPGTLTFFDSHTNRYYTTDEARNILGDSWVSDTLIMSESCSKAVIKSTLDILQKKRRSYPNHQALAIACSDEHARLLTRWFRDEGATATYVSSHLPDQENSKRINDFANHEYDVMVNIQMLGEGFDNPDISIVSMFRPFKSVPFYAQVIGRGIRLIRDPRAKTSDNFCDVIYHKELQLGELWKFYKEEIMFADIKKNNNIQLTFDLFDLGAVEKTPSGHSSSKRDRDDDTGSVKITAFGSIKEYKSAGLGNADSFTKGGYDDYRKANMELAVELEIKLQKELEERRAKYSKLLADKVIDLGEYKKLVSDIENKHQDEITKQNEHFRELITTEQMKKDFALWLNERISLLFQKISLDKEGYDLWSSLGPFAGDKVNNLGYIVSNIRKGLFEKTQKRVTSFNVRDFAAAKTFVNTKIDFYLKQYPLESE